MIGMATKAGFFRVPGARIDALTASRDSTRKTLLLSYNSGLGTDPTPQSAP